MKTIKKTILKINLAKSPSRLRIGASLLVIAALLSQTLTSPLKADPVSDAEAKLASVDIAAVFADLVERADRPSMGEILDRLGVAEAGPNRFTEITINNGNQTYKVRPNGNVIRDVRNHLAKTIAYLEKAYPGAIYAPLGRDAAPFGDAMDAFWASLGQTRRVSPLHSSGGGVRINDKALLARFVESAGFHFEDPMHHPPFLIMDRTSYDGSPNSQTARLLQASYHRYRDQGGNPADLVRKLNVVGLGVYGSQANPLYTTDLETYFTKQEAHVAQTAMNPTPANNFDRNGVPTQCLTVLWPGTMNGYTLTDVSNSEWHDGYGYLQIDSQGRVRGHLTYPPANSMTNPGMWSFRQKRLQAIVDKYEMYRVVSEPGFREQVAREARALGYEFPFGADSKLGEAEAAADTLVAKMPIMRRHSPWSSASKLTEWFDSYVEPVGALGGEPAVGRLAVMAVWYATKADRAGKLSDYTYQKVLVKVLSRVAGDASFRESTLPKLRQLIQENQNLKTALGRGTELVEGVTPETLAAYHGIASELLQAGGDCERILDSSASGKKAA